jgi:hypothetical protein
MTGASTNRHPTSDEDNKHAKEKKSAERGAGLRDAWGPEDRLWGCIQTGELRGGLFTLVGVVLASLGLGIF